MAEPNPRPRPDPRPSRPRPPAESDYAPTALPPTGARLLAFAAILLAGVCGGVIGYAFVDLQSSDGGSSLGQGVGALVGAVGGAGGVAVVATLALRAMGEWRTIQHRDESAEGRRRHNGGADRNGQPGPIDGRSG
jgi:hypothetical protein